MEFKKYNHLEEEKKISNFWIENDCFKPKKGKTTKKFSMGADHKYGQNKTTKIRVKNKYAKVLYKIFISEGFASTVKR